MSGIELRLVESPIHDRRMALYLPNGEVVYADIDPGNGAALVREALRADQRDKRGD